MKKILFAFLAVFALIATASAQSQQYIKVYKNGELNAIYYISEDETVEFSEDFPIPGNEYNGHRYVDLGLPSGLKWATCNVGASSPEEYGDYFAWGETETKETYLWTNSKWYDTTDKYTGTDNKTILDPEDDAAHMNWGEAWRMPTREELNELLENCTWLWSTKNGVDGYKVVGRNGNSIFLPAAGDMYSDRLWDESEMGKYWTSTCGENSSESSYALSYYIWNTPGENREERYYGLPVRPVFK